MKSYPVILGLAVTVALTPLAAFANPPSRADQGEQRAEHGNGNRGNPHEAAGGQHGRQSGPDHAAARGGHGTHSRRQQHRAPRISAAERDRFHHYAQDHRNDPALRPAPHREDGHGKPLPNGWRNNLHVGHRLPDDLYYRGQPVPSRFYGHDHRAGSGYTDILLDNEVVRVLNATQTIVDVFNLNR